VQNIQTKISGQLKLQNSKCNEEGKTRPTYVGTKIKNYFAKASDLPQNRLINVCLLSAGFFKSKMMAGTNKIL
jgi:hypothetical protein